MPVFDRLLTRRIEGPSPGNDTFNHPLPGPVTTLTIWTARRDFTGRDQVERTETGNVTLTDSRFIVRAEDPKWLVGDTFDHDGETFTVRGISRLRGRRLLELLARRIG